MTERTLAEINQNPTRREQLSYVLEHRVAVGGVGFRRSGEKHHWLSIEVVVGYVGDFQPTGRQFKIGDVFSAYARCNGNGQNVGKVDKRLDIQDINCRKCLGEKGTPAPKPAPAPKAAPKPKPVHEFEQCEACGRRHEPSKAQCYNCWKCHERTVPCKVTQKEVRESQERHASDPIRFRALTTTWTSLEALRAERGQ